MCISSSPKFGKHSEKSFEELGLLACLKIKQGRRPRSDKSTTSHSPWATPLQHLTRIIATYSWTTSKSWNINLAIFTHGLQRLKLYTYKGWKYTQLRKLWILFNPPCKKKQLIRFQKRLEKSEVIRRVNSILP